MTFTISVSANAATRVHADCGIYRPKIMNQIRFGNLILIYLFTYLIFFQKKKDMHSQQEPMFVLILKV